MFGDLQEVDSGLEYFTTNVAKMAALTTKLSTEHILSFKASYSNTVDHSQ